VSPPIDLSELKETILRRAAQRATACRGGGWRARRRLVRRLLLHPRDSD